METKEFIEKFAEALEMDALDLSLETEFRELDEWNSLAYLSVIAMLDDEYDTQIELEEFKQLRTLQSIMDYIEAHK